jgi:hypothetical protein
MGSQLNKSTLLCPFMVITELDRFSKLQKRILLEGLRAFLRAPIRRARGHEYPDCFWIDDILEDHFKLSRELLRCRYPRRVRALADNRAARNKLASPRAALSRALRHLISRALVARAKDRQWRRWWRLTSQGVELARALFPEEKPDPDLVPKLKEIYEKRSGSGARLPPSRRVFRHLYG